MALSGECFEHDPHWTATFANMVRMTRPGGLVAFSCASRGRVEHGTARSMARLSPGTRSVGIDYYANLEEDDFHRALPLAEMFCQYRFWYLPTHFDLFFVGVRSGDPAGRPQARIPSDAAVRRLRELMPLSHRLGRLPLRILSSFSAERRYQPIALRYRRFALKLAGRGSGSLC